MGSVARSMLDPVTGLEELLRLLDWHQQTATPTGITRGIIRDLCPAFTQLGLHHLVAVLDAHLPPVSLIQPDANAAAVRDAHHHLGPAATEAARAAGLRLDPAAAIALLRREVEAALAAAGSSHEVS